MAEQPKRTQWISIVLTLAVFAALYFYFKSPSRKYKSYTAVYHVVAGLQSSSPVMIKGVREGKIGAIEIDDSIVIVTILVNKNVNLPEDTRARLTSGGLLANMSIILEMGKSPNILADNAHMLSVLDSSAMPVSTRLTPYIETARYLLFSADSTMRGLDLLSSKGVLTSFFKPLTSAEKGIKQMASTSASADRSVTAFAAKIKGMDASLANLAGKSNNWNASLHNADRKSASLAHDSFGKTINQVAAIDRSIKKATAPAIDSTTAMGKLVNDKASYEHANSAMQDLNQNLTESYKSPTGFTIFGKSKKKKKK